jgi:molybdate transport system permease protein
MRLTAITLSTLLLFVFIVLSVVLSIVGKITPETLVTAINSEEVRFAVTLSLKSALIATTFALLVGIPSAYALARYNFRGKEIIDSLIDLPVVLPPLISGFGLLIFFGETDIGRLITDNIVNVVFTPYGIVVAQFFVATPFVIRTTRAVFENIDVKYEYIAQSLGSSRFESFLRVTLPLAKKGILAGAILAWARCIGEFGATLMLAGATKMRTETLPIAVFLNMSIGQIELALAIAFIMLLIAITTIFSIKFVVRSLS